MKRTFKKVFMISMLACMACTFVFAKGKKDKAAEEPTVVETEKDGFAPSAVSAEPTDPRDLSRSETDVSGSPQSDLCG